MSLKTDLIYLTENAKLPSLRTLGTYTVFSLFLKKKLFEESLKTDGEKKSLYYVFCHSMEE